MEYQLNKDIAMVLVLVNLMCSIFESASVHAWK